MQFDRKVFFDLYRDTFGKLSHDQVDGLGFLLSFFEQQRAYDDLLLPQIAYMLATTKHETASTFQPISERGRRDYFRKYDGRFGNVRAGDGWQYRGRGYVQLTFYDNYDKMGDIIGVDLIAEPDLCLQPEIAADIMLEGFIRGSFTGVGLKRYINHNQRDYYHARKVINGLDRAEDIAGYARHIYEMLAASQVLQDGSEETVF